MNRFFNGPGSKANAPRMIVKKDDKWYMTSRTDKWTLPRRPHGFNAGDSCWWTGLSVLTYKDKKLLEGLKSLTPIKGEVWRRHAWDLDLADTKDPINEFTRDHMISAITALSVKDLYSAKAAIKKTKMKLSARKTLSPSDWFWLKAIENEGTFKAKVFAKMCTTLKMPVILAHWGYSEMIKSILGKKAKQVHPNDKITPPLKFKAKHLKWISENVRLFAFQPHLWALQLHALRELNITNAPLLSAVVRGHAGRYNYLVSLLTGKKINRSIIKDYESRTTWLWQGWIDNITGKGGKCTEEEAKYNAMDKDLLWVLWNKLA